MSRATRPSPPTDQDIADRFAPLSDDDIKELTDSGSFSRGRSYFRRGAIVDPVLTGNTISAGCWGSDIHPYRVRATLAPRGAADNAPFAWDCSCPRGGFCKHVVALLLTWIDNPSAFTERPPLREALANRATDELIAIIERLVQHDPELRRLVELPVIGSNGSGSPTTITVDPATIRRQVDAIFQAPRYDDWHASGAIADDLEEVLRIGQTYARCGAWANAATVFVAMAEPLLDHYKQVEDHEGEVAGIIVGCDTGLAQCLDAQASLPENDRLPAELRRDVIDAIFDIWQFDIYDAGGIDLSQQGPESLVRAVTAEERAEILDQLHGLLKQEERNAAASGYASDWTRRATVGFEVMLKEEAGLAPEELLALYRDNGMWPEMAWLLLKQGQITDALAVAGRHLTRAHELLPFATAVRDLGGKNVEAAIDLVDARLWETEGKDAREDEQLRVWLEDSYAKHGSPAKALEIARHRFTHAPSFATYQAVRKVATLPGQPEETWPRVRDELLTTLRGKTAWGDLVRIALDEGDVPAAVAALAEHDKTTTARTFGWSTTHSWFTGLDIAVAEAAEESVPDEAIRLYRRAAGQAIKARGRGNYQQAAEYLARVKRLLTATRRADEWRRLITDVRTENKRLRALLQELDARKLT